MQSHSILWSSNAKQMTETLPYNVTKNAAMAHMIKDK